MLFRVVSEVGLGMGVIVEWDEADREKVTLVRATETYTNKSK